jgi:hypothetical protein
VRAFLLALLLGACSTGRAADERRVILVTIDGTRWQEVFGGAERALLSVAGSPFWRESREERRRALMPFLWGTVVAGGQIFGDVAGGSRIHVGNPHRISYPGYHDLLNGFTSLDINGNDRIPNPDVTVLEWLDGRPGFRRRVAVFASWELFPFVFNVERSGLHVDVGQRRDRGRLLDRLRGEVAPPWRGAVYDAFTVQAALRHLDSHDVRVLHLALNDPDEWGHAGKYDRYLESIHRADGWVRELWTKVQAAPAFRGRTSLIITTDHGRGSTGQTWSKHAPTVEGAQEAWLAVLGPGVAALGARSGHPPLSLTQVAATVGALVGEDFRAAVPQAAPSLPLK